MTVIAGFIGAVLGALAVGPLTFALLRPHMLQLQRLAYTDEATSLANRRAMTRALQDLPPTAMLAVLLVDLDDFKSINDAQGHDFGDAVLRVTANRLRAGLPSAMTVRLGGDEFAVIVQLGDVDFTRAEDTARVIATAVHDVVAQPFALPSTAPLPIRASVGASSGLAGQAPALLHGADLVMYAAKHGGTDTAYGPPVQPPARPVCRPRDDRGARHRAKAA